VIQDVYDLENPSQRQAFLQGKTQEIAVPQSSRVVVTDPGKRVGVGISKLGANRAVGVGAYAFALNHL
jgi:glucokinase